MDVYSPSPLLSMCHGHYKKCVGGSALFALVIIGALNWGLVGLGWLMGGKDLNVVHMLVGAWPMVEGVIYFAVGVAGLLKLIFVFTGCCFGMCKSNKCVCCDDKGNCCSGCDGKCDGHCDCHGHEGGSAAAKPPAM